MRLFIISIMVISITFLGGLIIRLWSLGLPYKKFDHPFFSYEQSSQIPPYLMVNSDSDSVGIQKVDILMQQEWTLSTSRPFKTIPSAFNILLVPIYSSSEGYIFIGSPNNVSHTVTELQKKKLEKKSFSTSNRYIHDYRWSEIDNDSFILFKDWFSKTQLNTNPKNHFILNILSNHSDIHKSIIKLIDDLGIADQIVVSSEYDVIITSIKNERPMWAYGTSLSELTRLKSFSTIGLEPALTIRGDLFFCYQHWMKRELCTANIAEEAIRRKKRVLLFN